MTQTLTTTLAHAGPHDLSTGGGIFHTLTAPDHLVAAAACIVGAYATFFVHRRLTSPKPQVARAPTPSASGKGRG